MRTSDLDTTRALLNAERIDIVVTCFIKISKFHYGCIFHRMQDKEFAVVTHIRSPNSI
jgi:hypothetical protein